MSAPNLPESAVSKSMTASSAVEAVLNKKLAVLERRLTADVVAYFGAIADGTDEAFRDAIEARRVRKAKLAIVLETPGGYIEVAERIVTVTRNHYEEVEFYIPSAAMSAGTVLVMSGDAIHMDYYSVLGPIDPQVQRPGGKGMIPALGYLVQYERLLQKGAAGTLTTAEMHFLIQKFDPAELHFFEQARELTITLLKQWLTKYKFKNWLRTEGRGLDVTPEMKERRAAEVATILNDPTKWHSHARGLSMEVVRRELKLQVEDFGRDAELCTALRTYHRLTTDFMRKMGHGDVLHSQGRYRPLAGE